MTDDIKISVRNLYKIFGDDPKMIENDNEDQMNMSTEPSDDAQRATTGSRPPSRWGTLAGTGARNCSASLRWLALEEEASCTEEVFFCTTLAVRERRSGSYTALAARQLRQEQSRGSCAANAARGACRSVH